MRWPRPRLTIGGMMILVLIVGLSIWGYDEVKRRLQCSPSEDRAYVAYRSATLHGETVDLQAQLYEDPTMRKDLRDSVKPAAILLYQSKRDLELLTWRSKIRAQGRLIKEIFDPKAEARAAEEFATKYVEDCIAEQRAEVMSEQLKSRSEQDRLWQEWQRERTRRIWWGR